jgi:hypothetical protein
MKLYIVLPKRKYKIVNVNSTNTIILLNSLLSKLFKARYENPQKIGIKKKSGNPT